MALKTVKDSPWWGGSNRVHIHSRRQLAVGQGCFHIGVVGTTDPLRYVYDCGALSKYARRLKEEIAGYHAWIEQAPLDLLFISHLHADHVAGLPQLLAPISVDTIVMPLVNVVDRVIAFARTAAEAPADADNQFYRDMIADPVAAVARFDPRQVILVTRGDGPAAEGGPDAERDPPGLDGQGPKDSSEREGRSRWRLAGRGPVEQVPRREVAGAAMGAAIYQMPDSRGFEVALHAGYSWMLAPFVDPTVEAGRAAFLGALATALGKTPVEIDALLSDEPEAVLFLLATYKPGLIAAYQAVADLNVTSLCLYSGPSGSDWPATLWEAGLGRAGMYPNLWLSEPDPVASVGWIGTGDADLADDARRAAFLAHYRPHSEKIATFLLPHHGSSENFHAELFDGLTPRLAAVSAAPFSNWQHPGVSVVHAACGKGVPLWVTNHEPDSRLFEFVFVDPPVSPAATFL